MRTNSDLTNRQAAEGYFTGNPASEAARRKIFEDTGIDLPPKKADPVTDGKALAGFLVCAAIALLAAPFYISARGLWMTEPALQPHDVDTGLLMGFAVFALASLGLYLTFGRRVHPLPAFVAVGTVMSFGILGAEGGWGLTAFLLAELAFLAAWTQRRRVAAIGEEKAWKRVRDWVGLILCAFVLITFTVNPTGDTAAEALADAGRQLQALPAGGYMARAGEIAAPFGLPAVAAALGIPAALALLYVPLTWCVSKVMRWA
ncbi:MAG: hypothetical protein KDA53_16985 [Hyphomonas sp.]|nr:hypothetical protein [Hyphomonas sp.]